MVFVTTTFGGISGVDFIRLLATICPAARQAFALLSNPDTGHDDLQLLPENTSMIPFVTYMYDDLQTFERQTQGS